MKAKSNRLVKELTAALFIVEGEITDLILYDLIESSSKNTASISTDVISSALAKHTGRVSLDEFSAYSKAFNIRVFAVELRDHQDKLHYFKGCFPEVIYKIGDQIKIVAQPLKPECAYISALIDERKQYIWTSQMVVNGRFRSRLLMLKTIFKITIIVYLLIFFCLYFIPGGLELLFNLKFLGVALLILLLAAGGGWWLGVCFDEQNIELEAILIKQGFYNPTMMNLNQYSVEIVDFERRESEGEPTLRWMQYAFRIDLAKKDDAEKYGKNNK